MTARSKAPLLTLCLTLAGPLWGAGYEFEGVGARQVSRGGAVVADVADWTALYWNPAGLAGLDGGQAAFEAFGGVARSDDGNSLSGSPAGAAFGKTHLDSSFLLGTLGVARGDGRWGWGAGVYTPLLQGSDFDDANALAALDYKASAGIVVVNFSLARAFGHGVSAGVGLNAVRAAFNAKFRLESPPTASTLASKLSGDGWGPEGLAGVRWAVNDRWRVGAVLRTGSRIPVKGDSEAVSVSPLGTLAESSPFRLTFNHPATAAAGVSWDAAPRTTVSFDVNHTNWRSFRGDIDVENPGLLLADVPNVYHWRNTFKFRLGGLHRLSGRTELLAGISYDNYALDNGSVDFSTAIDVPIVRFYAGASRRLGDDWTLSGGLVAAQGRRTDDDRGVTYTLGGWEGMLGIARNFTGAAR